MSDMQREKDLVLNPNQYAFVLDKTKGIISTAVGPFKTSLSTTDRCVRYNTDKNKFEECELEEGINSFISVPENWYVELKNPAKNGMHPIEGKSNELVSLDVGKKINITGNTTFALYPGQIAKLIEGHTLHSNQYLLAKVYDTEALNETEKNEEATKEPTTEDGSKVEEKKNEKNTEVSSPKYKIGQIIIIKGTDTQFYIPPTGIKVIPIKNEDRYGYVRDAVTLERLEYCIKKNEAGEKKYIHGPAVVFPEPDEMFLTNPDDKDSKKFRAIELSDTSGIYIKVIADYTEKGITHKTGEELFITGKDERIYYPRQEHAIIDYDGKIVHHAIAIPVGEGRYVLNRNTGVIETIKGPAMYLPDPRTQVIVNRKLTEKQCNLWYPGNKDVLKHNVLNHKDENEDGYSGFDEDFLSSRMTKKAFRVSVEENSGFSRGTTYTPPRSITLDTPDNKFNGAVRIDVWTGFAINVVSKNGNRNIIKGPQSHILNYDETLEILELSTGKPKTTDNLLPTVFLRTDNNKVSDIIHVQTNDFVDVDIKVSYNVNFLEEYKDKWFSVENYVKFMCDRQRSILKKEVKKYTIEEFYGKANEIVRNTLLAIKDGVECEASIIDVDENTTLVKADVVTNDTPDVNNVGQLSSISTYGAVGRLFEENGMFVSDVDVLSVHINDSDIEQMFDNAQLEAVRDIINLNKERRGKAILSESALIQKETEKIIHDRDIDIDNLQTEAKKLAKENEIKLEKLSKELENLNLKNEAEKQKLYDEIQKAKLARVTDIANERIREMKENNEIEKDREYSQTNNMVDLMNSISSELVAAMTSKANVELLDSLTTNMSAYALAEDMSVVDAAVKLLKDTPSEKVLKSLLTKLTTSSILDIEGLSIDRGAENVKDIVENEENTLESASDDLQENN